MDTNPPSTDCEIEGLPSEVRHLLDGRCAGFRRRAGSFTSCKPSLVQASWLDIQPIHHAMRVVCNHLVGATAGRRLTNVNAISGNPMKMLHPCLRGGAAG